MGGGEVVGTSIDGAKTGTTGNCSVDKVGELGTGKSEDGIANFDKQADEYALYDLSGRRRKLGTYDISMVLSDRQASLS